MTTALSTTYTALKASISYHNIRKNQRHGKSFTVKYSKQTSIYRTLRHYRYQLF